MFISTLFKGISGIALILMTLAPVCHAASSTDPRILPRVGAPQSYQAKVDTTDCTPPIKSLSMSLLAEMEEQMV